MAAKAARWKKYHHGTEVVEAFQIRDVQTLIGGGAELIGCGGESQVVSQSFVDESEPAEGEWVIRVKKDDIRIWLDMEGFVIEGSTR